LYSKRVTARPSHFVFGLAIGADGNPLDLFSQAGGTDDAHSPAAMGAPEDFLQHSSFPLILLSFKNPLE
jgi:hypothetical protein